MNKPSASLHIFQHRFFLGFEHLLGEHQGWDVGELLDLAAAEYLFGVLDRLLADKIGELRHRSVESAGEDRFDGVAVAVDADDQQLVFACRAPYFTGFPPPFSSCLT